MEKKQKSIKNYTKRKIWQGDGTGYLSIPMEKKEERVQEFVTKAMEKYPPGKNNDH